MSNQPDLNRLKSTLMTSGLQTRDNPTFQTINGLITAVKDIQSIVNNELTTISGNTSGFTAGSVLFADYLGNIGEDNAHFFYDSSLFSLRVNEATISTPFSGSLFIGNGAGAGAVNCTNQIFLGQAGAAADTVTDGFGAGVSTLESAANIAFPAAIGSFALSGAVNCSIPLAIGSFACSSLINSTEAIGIGSQSLGSASNANYTIGIGSNTWNSASGAAQGIAIGRNAGNGDTVDNTGGDYFSILLGPYTSTGGYSNSIAIGQGAQNTTTQQFNIGNVLYGTGMYIGTTPDGTPSTTGGISIGATAPVITQDLVSAYRDINDASQISVYNPSAGNAAYANLAVFADITSGSFSAFSSAFSFGAAGLGFCQFYTNNSINLMADSANGIINFATGGTTEVARLDNAGRLGIGVTTPTAFLHLKAGTTAASTAPLKFNSGSLLTTAEAGGVEFLTDKFYGTITTGASRKEFTLNDSALTSGIIPVATTNGRLTDSSLSVASLTTIVGNDRSTGQTASKTLATYTVGASDTTYYVSANVNITTSTLFSFGVTCTYKDETNTSRTLNLTFSNLAGTFLQTITNALGAGAYEGVPLQIRAKAGTTIIIASTGTFTTVTYNLEERIVMV